jgi:GntR family transcriptional regulator, rspAB operon transcriptional repressor
MRDSATARPLANLLERRGLGQQVFGYVKKMILSGELRGGEKIPEERIAERFGVSRTPIREALRKLEEYGLVRIEPRSYAEVVSIDAEDAAAIAEVRAPIEALAGRLVASRASKDDVARLRSIAADCRRALLAKDLGAVFEADGVFHREIAIRSGNAHLLELFDRLDAKIQLCRLVLCVTLDQVSGAVAQHGPILDAIAKGDGERAARLLSSHALSATHKP